MESVNVIPASLLTAFLFVLIVSLVFRRPLKGLWLILLVVFFATWSGQLWLTPMGPVYFGVSPLSLISVALGVILFLLLIGAPISRAAGTEKTDSDTPAQNAAGANVQRLSFGFMMWLLLFVLILTIIYAYYKSN